MLERTADTMCGIGSLQNVTYCTANNSRADGQLMHHFVSLVPDYQSIATSTQLGPNIFWTMTALEYAAVSGNISWIQAMLPYIEKSASYILSFWDANTQLLSVPGPLWIDVIVRENFTSDSNAAAVMILNKLADALEYLDRNGVQSRKLRSTSSAIAGAMNKLLWSPEDDHFITQLNPDGTTRDFVDYDSNLLA